MYVQDLRFRVWDAPVLARDGGFEAEARIGAHWREKVVVSGTGFSSQKVFVAKVNSRTNLSTYPSFFLM